MKSNDTALQGEGSLNAELRRLLDGPLAHPESVRLALRGAASGELRYGFHSHDAWELFCPLQGVLRFEVAGQPEVEIPSGTLHIVPPACLHMDIRFLAQPPDLLLLVMNLPGEDANYGGVGVGSLHDPHERSALSAAGLAAWKALLGEAPAALMERVTAALSGGTWGHERALGLLRVLVTAYAEVAEGSGPALGAPSERRVSDALNYLQTHYYERSLSLAKVAKAVGLSPSHLSCLFRQVTGRSLHQTLLDIRMRRALALLEQEGLTIKQIAALTGWSNQLYFSAAFRRRYGRPPSAVRVAL